MQIDKEEAAAKEGEYQMVMMMNQKLYLMSVVNNGDPYIELKGTLTCLTEQLKVSHVFDSEGLLLCIFKDDNENTKLMVWNPYCLRPKWFEPRYSYNQLIGHYPCLYGLGYVENRKKTSSGRSHKISRFIYTYYTHYVIQERFSWYEIYDVESDSWKTLDITPLWSIKFDGFGITVKGNTYWSVKRSYEDDIHIICFDFTKERFGPFMHLPYNADVHDNVILSCVREEKLAALLEHFRPNPNDFEIWITTEIDPEKLTWSKFLTVNLRSEISYALESFIIDEEKKLVIIIGFDDKITIIGEFGYFRELDLFEESDDDVCSKFTANQATCRWQKGRN